MVVRYVPHLASPAKNASDKDPFVISKAEFVNVQDFVQLDIIQFVALMEESTPIHVTLMLLLAESRKLLPFVHVMVNYPKRKLYVYSFISCQFLLNDVPEHGNITLASNNWSK